MTLRWEQILLAAACFITLSSVSISVGDYFLHSLRRQAHDGTWCVLFDESGNPSTRYGSRACGIEP